MNKLKLQNRFKNNKTIISNFNYLSILQLFELLIPLITYPYLIRVLGKEVYGLVAFSSAIIAYIMVFVNFGFEISEIKEISINRENKKKVSEIVSAVFVTKIGFAIFSIFVLTLFVNIIPELSKHKLLYFASLGLILDTAINPRFYFQGIEKMMFITLLTVVSKLLFLILIFYIIKSPTHYYLVPFLTSIGLLTSSFIGLKILFSKEKVNFQFPSFLIIKKSIVNSFPFFTSRVSVLAINKTNVLLLGAFVGYTEVAYYDLAEKLVNVMKMPFNVFNQVLFPNVSKTKNIGLVLKTLKVLLVFYVFGYFILYLISEPLIVIFAGNVMVASKSVLYVLGITAITELISVFLGAPILLAMGYKKHYNASIIWGSVFYILIVTSLYSFGYIGLYSLAASTVASSLFVMFYRTWYCYKFKFI